MNTRILTRRDWMMGCAAAGVGLALVGSRARVLADEAEVTAARLKALKSCTALSAMLRYFGDQDKPFYEITFILRNPGISEESDGEVNSFKRVTWLEREAMLKFLDALGKDGFIAAARDVSKKDIKPAQGYSLTLHASKTDAGDEFKALGWPSVNGHGRVELHQALGWDLAMIERLEKLGPALSGDAAKDLELLLGRLSGLKREWQKGR